MLSVTLFTKFNLAETELGDTNVNKGQGVMLAQMVDLNFVDWGHLLLVWFIKSIFILRISNWLIINCLATNTHELKRDKQSITPRSYCTPFATCVIWSKMSLHMNLALLALRFTTCKSREARTHFLTWRMRCSASSCSQAFCHSKPACWSGCRCGKVAQQVCRILFNWFRFSAWIWSFLWKRFFTAPWLCFRCFLKGLWCLLWKVRTLFFTEWRKCLWLWSKEPSLERGRAF